MRQGFVLVIAAACGAETTKNERPPDLQTPKDAAAGSASAPVDAAAPNGPSLADITAWMPKDAKQQLQGAWFTKLALRDAGMASYTGSYVALEIKGDKATAWVPATNTEHVLDVKIETPCAITFSQTKDGATNYYRRNYLVENGTVFIGWGAVGYRKGKSALACVYDDIYVLDDKGGCRLYKESFGKWQAEDAKCTWGKAPDWAQFERDKGLGTEGLIIERGSSKEELVTKGDVLLNTFFRAAMFEGHRGAIPEHRKEADFAAAKATAEKRWKETDIVEILKTAGGKPGETKTILDFFTTFKQDKSKLKGQKAQLTGKIAEKRDKKETDGKVEWVVLVVDPRRWAEKDFAIRCVAAKEIKKPVGATVTISGTAGEYWDDPALTDCVAK